MTNHINRREPGQVIVLFVLALVAMFAVAGLLFDGGQALSLRRQLQDASDAAAIAASNVIQTGTPRGCSATAGPPAGAPRAAVITAAQDAVHASLPNFPNANISVTCVSTTPFNNIAVEVGLSGRSAGYFGGIVGMNGFDVRTTSQAVNGQVASVKFSVVELDPGHFTAPNLWANGYQGCPSVSFAGSNTVTFDGSLQVNSACNNSSGAIAVGGNSAHVQFNNGAGAFVVGTQATSPNPVSPITTGAAPVLDPLRNLATIPYNSWTATVSPLWTPIQSATQLTISGGTRVLEPGIYVGGIQMKNSAAAYMHPGIYVMLDALNGDGGFQMGASNKLYSIPANLCTTLPTSCTTTDSSWATDCPATISSSGTCGVLIYVVGQACASGGSPKDRVEVGAGATLKLRPYVSTADGTGTNEPNYNNLLLWQDKNPQPSGPPSSTCNQPPISLSGGGSISISGTLYAPSALVQMAGNSGGAGGSSLDVTLQFISWDLSFNGGINFHFLYQSDSLWKPTDYGLIQ